MQQQQKNLQNLYNQNATVCVTKFPRHQENQQLNQKLNVKEIKSIRQPEQK